MEMNEVLEKLPRHLMDFVIEQPYDNYTARDHAVWRYVMRQNVRYLSKVAHASYLEGLKRTGISIDRIPRMYGMNRILREIGWAAVAVDGFIPPAAFMEFQAFNVLVITADIRPIDQIEYTPAPDIIHEAAGHAPIIANDEYADYLRRFGWFGTRAFSSKKDYDLYEAIRHLSILKSDPNSSEKEVIQAKEYLNCVESDMGGPSEMALIRNLHWWTVEYGLIGEINDPKIYGAGLLSSIGESYSCLQPNVKKLPYTIGAAKIGFDITTRQPQLFVTPDFAHLNTVLEEFADTMAIRRGGKDAVQKAVNSGNTATLEWSSGLQVSGTFHDCIINDDPVYLHTKGETSFNFEDHELPGYNKERKPGGFGSPVGKLKGTDKPLELMTEGELREMKVIPGSRVRLEFENGVTVEGTLKDTVSRDGNNLLFTFYDSKAEMNGKTIPGSVGGLYDMAIGEKIVSGFNGPADPKAFGLRYTVPKEKSHKPVYDRKTVQLHDLYQDIRDSREKNINSIDDLRKVFRKLQKEHADDWLLPMEILELLHKRYDDDGFEKEVRDYLVNMKDKKPELDTLVRNGFTSIYEETVHSN